MSSSRIFNDNIAEYCIDVNIIQKYNHGEKKINLICSRNISYIFFPSLFRTIWYYFLCIRIRQQDKNFAILSGKHFIHYKFNLTIWKFSIFEILMIVSNISPVNNIFKFILGFQPVPKSLKKWNSIKTDERLAEKIRWDLCSRCTGKRSGRIFIDIHYQRRWVRVRTEC